MLRYTFEIGYSLFMDEYVVHMSSMNLSSPELFDETQVSGVSECSLHVYPIQLPFRTSAYIP